MTESEGLRDKLARSSEDALGKIAQDLLENPLVNGAISRAFEARERAVQAQEAAMGALNIPSAADIERLTRRLRSVSQRLEGIEDAVDRLDGRLEGIEGSVGSLTGQLEGIEGSVSGLGGRIEETGRAARASGELDALHARLEEIARDIAALRETLAPGGEPPPRAQERLTVSEP